MKEKSLEQKLIEVNKANVDMAFMLYRERKGRISTYILSFVVGFALASIILFFV